MQFIKKFLITIFIVTILLVASVGFDDENLIKKLAYATAIVSGIMILYLLAKIAWRILIFILLLMFMFFLLSYFDIIEFSKQGIETATEKVYDKATSEIKLTK